MGSHARFVRRWIAPSAESMCRSPPASSKTHMVPAEEKCAALHRSRKDERRRSPPHRAPPTPWRRRWDDAPPAPLEPMHLDHRQTGRIARLCLQCARAKHDDGGKQRKGAGAERVRGVWVGRPGTHGGPRSGGVSALPPTMCPARDGAHASSDVVGVGCETSRGDVFRVSAVRAVSRASTRPSRARRVVCSDPETRARRWP